MHLPPRFINKCNELEYLIEYLISQDNLFRKCENCRTVFVSTRYPRYLFILVGFLTTKNSTQLQQSLHSSRTRTHNCAPTQIHRVYSTGNIINERRTYLASIRDSAVFLGPRIEKPPSLTFRASIQNGNYPHPDALARPGVRVYRKTEAIRRQEKRTIFGQRRQSDDGIKKLSAICMGEG